jgi:hypothetical protein
MPHDLSGQEKTTFSRSIAESSNLRNRLFMAVTTNHNCLNLQTVISICSWLGHAPHTIRDGIWPKSGFRSVRSLTALSRA